MQGLFGAAFLTQRVIFANVCSRFESAGSGGSVAEGVGLMMLQTFKTLVAFVAAVGLAACAHAGGHEDSTPRSSVPDWMIVKKGTRHNRGGSVAAWLIFLRKTRCRNGRVSVATILQRSKPLHSCFARSSSNGRRRHRLK